VLVLVLENNCTTEDENDDEDEPVERVLHTGSLARFNVRTGSEFDRIRPDNLLARRPALFYK
ncbi:MAG TPA: hypothetical protein VFR76_04975, partial [Verrucomicrobiae bacterium]|nr:hypothetical protein [Verrucomicrobiae bacterium]